MWSRLAAPSVRNYNMRIPLLDYVISQPIISINFSRVFSILAFKIKINSPLTASSSVLGVLGLHTVRKDYLPDSLTATTFWENFNILINNFINNKNYFSHEYHGIVFIYVLKQYSYHKNMEENIKHECPYPVCGNPILCSKLRDDVQKNFIISTNPEKAIFGCKLDFIKELLPELKKDITVYLHKKKK